MLWPRSWLELLSPVNEASLRNAEGSNAKVRIFVAALKVVCDRQKDLTRLVVRLRLSLKSGRQGRRRWRVHGGTRRGRLVREASSLLIIRSKESRPREGSVGH